MKNYKLALESIHKVKEIIKDMSFDDASKKLAGYNCDNLTFDFDYGNITGTVWNKNGKAKIYEDSTYDIIDDDWEHNSEPIEYNVSESEIKIKKEKNHV